GRGQNLHRGWVSELGQHSEAEPEMFPDSGLFSGVSDFLVRTVQRVNPTSRCPLRKVLDRARERVEPLRVLGCCDPPFCKCSIKPKFIASAILVKTVGILSTLCGINTPD